MNFMSSVAAQTAAEALIDEEAIRNHIQRVVGVLPNDAYILIWTLQDKRTRAFLVPWKNGNRPVDEIVAYIQEAARTKDVYLGVGWGRFDPGEKRRFKKHEVEGCLCLWTDIDIRHWVHKGTALPITQAEALSILDAVPLRPTRILDSGHGIQAFWDVQRELLAPTDSTVLSAQQAEELELRLFHLIDTAAHARGWEMDHVVDVSRVMRIEGTVNHKELWSEEKHEGETPDLRPVRLLASIARGYTADELWHALPPVPKHLATSETFDTNHGAQIEDADLLRRIKKSRQSKKFNALWAGDTSEYKGDESNADMALAGILAFWTGRDEARVDQLFRQSRLMREKWDKSGHFPGERTYEGQYRSVTRTDPTWGEWTVAKACANAVKVYTPHNDSADDEEDADEDAEMPEGEPTADEARQWILKSIGLDIARVLKYGIHDASYVLEFAMPSGATKKVNVATTTHLRSHGAMWDRLYEAGLPLRKFTLKRWRTITARYLRALEEFVPIMSEEDETEAWITEYMSLNIDIGWGDFEHDGPYTRQKLRDAQEIKPTEVQGGSFSRRGIRDMRDGRVFFPLEKFRQWVNLHYRQNQTPKSLGTRLRKAGFADKRTPESWGSPRVTYWTRLAPVFDVRESNDD